jgi:hypothetical protein
LIAIVAFILQHPQPTWDWEKDFLSMAKDMMRTQNADHEILKGLQKIASKIARFDLDPSIFPSCDGPSSEVRSHSSHPNPTMANPRDGPATSFVPDEDVRALALWRQDPSKKPDDEFGLVLVAGWPPIPEMTKQYDTFLQLVRQCFEPSDLH